MSRTPLDAQGAGRASATPEQTDAEAPWTDGRDPMTDAPVGADGGPDPAEPFDPAPAEDEAQLAVWLRTVAAQGNDTEAAMVRLYDGVAPRLRGFLRGQGLSDADAQDVVQEVFIKVMRSAGQFAGQSASGWIFRIARNLLIDRSRSRNAWMDSRELRRSMTTSDEDEPGSIHIDRLPMQALVAGTGEDWREAEALDDCVRQQMLRFRAHEPARAQALELTALEGWRIEQLAAHLGRTAGATRQYLSECRKKLRRFLEPCLALLPS